MQPRRRLPSGILLAGAVAACPWTTGAAEPSSASSQPALAERRPLEEPSASTYFGLPSDSADPVPLERVRDIDPDEFERRMRLGIPFIIQDAGRGNPFLGSSCEDFHRRWPDAQMRAEYSGGDRETFVSLGDASWFRKDRPVKPRKQHLAGTKAMLNGPYVWHVKDGGHEAPPAVRAEVQATWRPPYFLRGLVNVREANESTEFWFSRRRGAVFAHADTYCIPAVSLQLTGRKEWRLMPAPPLRSAVGRYDSHDGQIYRSGLWHPTYTATVEAGEAVVLFPNLFHETFVPEEGNPECTVASTFQFQLPVPTRYIRAFLPTLATSHLYYEGHCRDLWHSYALLAPRRAERPTRNETAARASAEARFAEADADRDGRLTIEEAEAYLAAPARSWARWFLTDDYFYDFQPGAAERQAMSDELLRARARDTVAYADTDNDGTVSTAEFAAAWWQWSVVHHRLAAQESFEKRGASQKDILAAERKYAKYGAIGRKASHAEL